MSMGKVLIVDDEMAIVKLVMVLLERHNYEVFAAYGGLDGVKMAQKELPDLIIMDVMMPQMDGLEAIKRLKEIKETKDIPVIVLSALGHEMELSRGLEVGAEDYFVKPFNPQLFVSKVKDIIDKSKSEED